MIKMYLQLWVVNIKGNITNLAERRQQGRDSSHKLKKSIQVIIGNLTHNKVSKWCVSVMCGWVKVCVLELKKEEKPNLKLVELKAGILMRKRWYFIIFLVEFIHIVQVYSEDRKNIFFQMKENSNRAVVHNGNP